MGGKTAWGQPEAAHLVGGPMDGANLWVEARPVIMVPLQPHDHLCDPNAVPELRWAVYRRGLRVLIGCVRVYEFDFIGRQRFDFLRGVR